MFFFSSTAYSKLQPTAHSGGLIGVSALPPATASQCRHDAPVTAAADLIAVDASPLDQLLAAAAYTDVTRTPTGAGKLFTYMIVLSGR